MKNRVLSTQSLLFASISAIIGSGWLFAAYYSATMAGPASIISWIIGGLITLVIAFIFADLSAFLPVTGASIRATRCTHGKLVGFIFAWIIWLSYIALTSTEVQAITQYCNFFFPNLVHIDGSLTSNGYLFSTCLMLFVTCINFYSLRWLINCNNILTFIKLFIPIFIALAIIASILLHNHLGNATPIPATSQDLAFLPYGWKGVLAAITSGGIVFAFTGFKQASEMAGEAANPEKALPRAIIGSVAICLVIFLCLQLAFLSTIHNNGGLAMWQSMKLSGVNSPFSVILIQNHLNILLPILYVGAIIGPLAAGLMYFASASRSLYAMSQNGTLPEFFKDLTPQGTPKKAIWINFLFGMCLFAPLPGWNMMASFLSSLLALTYSITPICVLSFHFRLPERKRFFKLPFPILWNILAFYLSSLLFYWSGWTIASKFVIALALGLAILFLYKLFSKKALVLDWKRSLWIWPYFIGMILISYYGEFDGGKMLIPFGWDFVLIAILSLFTIWFGVKSSYARAAIEDQLNLIKS